MLQSSHIEIIIIEDNNLHANYIESLLVKILNCNVKCIDNSKEAFNYLTSSDNSPDIVLVDYELPDINGIDLITKIRKAGREYGFIFLTASNRIDVVINAMKVGALDFIQKSDKLEEELPQMVEKVYKLHQGRLKEIKLRELDSTKINNLSTFFNTTNDLLWVLDYNWNLQYYNKTFYNRLNFSETELIGKSMLEVIPNEFHQKILNVLEQLNSKNSNHNFIPLITNTNEIISVETSFINGIWNQKKAIFAVSKDISDLKLSEEKFAKAFQSNSAISAISSWDSFEYIDVNDQFTIQLEYSKDEVLGKSSLELGIIDTAIKYQIKENLLNKGKVRNKEVKAYTKSKTQIDCLYSSELFQVNNQKFIYTSLVNISDRKKALKKIQQSEYQLKEAQKLASMGSYIYNIEKDKWTGSEVLEEIFGLEKAYVGNFIDWLNIAHPEIRDNLQKYFLENILTNHDLFNKEYKIIRVNDKTERWVHGLGRLEFNKLGKPIKMIGTIQDITEKKEANEVLRQYEHIVSSSNDMLALLDTNYNYLAANKSYLEAYKLSQNQLREKTIIDLLGMEFFEETIRPKINKCLEGENVTYDAWFNLPSKKNCYLTVSYTPYRLENNKIAGFVINGRDITKRKLAEDSLLEKEKNLIELNATKDKFFSIIAHDLKSPFNSMLGFADTLIQSFEEYSVAEQKEFLGYIYEGLENTHELLENLLNWSRAQQGVFNFKPKKQNFKTFSEENLKLLHQQAKKKSISLINLINQDIFIEFDSDMLATILRNLISNAIKYTYEGGKIELSAKPINKNTEFEFSVKDNGIGIKPESQKKLFKITENITTNGTNQEKGTGLGLITCKEFVEKHKGTIRIESSVGQGSTFLFTLPITTKLKE